MKTTPTFSSMYNGWMPAWQSFILDCPFSILAAIVLLLSSVPSTSAAVRYVDLNSASPTPPYTNWTTAAANIQDAVDAAAAGDEVVVTNGVYATGGRAVVGTMTNRVTVGKAMTVRSVNGPQFTMIQGRQVPVTTNGDGAIRCVYLARGATLSGFTLTNGATRTEGQPELEQSGGGLWCGSTNAAVSNCVLAGNSSSYNGGGAYRGTLNNCTLTANSAGSAGGGAYLGAQNGINGGTLNNCTLSGNSAAVGGGAYLGTLNNCLLTGNSAGSGGGATGGTLNNCTLTGNSAAHGGGGADSCTVNNCIVFFNTAAQDANYSPGTLNYCCTTPLPTYGIGNIALNPQLASGSHLSVGSPCRGAGSNDYAAGTDIDGEAWASPPSIGCDEFHAGAVTGPLGVGIVVTLTNFAPGYPVGLTALIAGRTTVSTWDFGDGVGVTNQPYTTHVWTAPGDYMVVLRAYNESHPAGVSANLTVHVGPPVHYVATDSGNPVSPYVSWATAARTIQDAVDAAAVGALVLVTNGTYASGGRAVVGTMTNRVVVSKPLTLRSVNGPQFTVIHGRQLPGTTNGNGAIRCVYLASGATLSGFTLTNGATRIEGEELELSGGGLWCESTNAVVSNCVLAGNSASYNGGGAYRGSLNNCTLTGNSAYGGGGVSGGMLKNCTLTGNSADQGGGAESSTLNNCTLTGNRATGIYFSWGGGGASFSTLNNCIVSFNWAPQNANYAGSSLRYCCTSPLPDWGTGNISVDPLLADASHLSGASPCRGAGNAEFAMGADIDGEAWAEPPSIGCDEYHVGPVTGPLSLSIAAAFTNVAAGFTVNFSGSILGHAGSNSWDFGDGTIVHSQFYQPLASHSWSSAGDYAVVLRAYNGSHPGGVSATVTVHVVTAPVHYVSIGSTNPVPPYVSWGTAARTIQDAVDSVTVVGALVLVTNGVYQTGGRAAIDGDANRVAVDKPLTLRSVNGPEFTVICGKYTTRGVYLTIGAVLTGFTLTNGWAGSGGGIFCESPSAVVSNCVLVNNGANEGGGAYGGTLDNCTLVGNDAWGGNGGGVYGGTLNNCALEGNWTSFQTIATEGGGAYKSTLNNCTLTGNSAEMGNGGGAARSLLNNCQLIGNAAGLNGGGTYLGTLNNCTLTDNSATTGGGAGGFYHCFDLCSEGRPVLNNCTLNNNSAHDGGGAAWSTLNHCTLTGNRATGADWWNGGGGAWQSGMQNCTLTGNSAQYGGGVSWCDLTNCTLTGNMATNSGGGASYGSLKNCIVYSNTATNGANYNSLGLNYCCTTPMPTNGIGNITNAPLFLDYASGNLRLQSNSPCINAGNNAFAPAGPDLDGNPRLAGGTVDIGAYECQSPALLDYYSWMQSYGLPTGSSAVYADSDGDRMNNWQEWIAGTIPTNALSQLRLLEPIFTPSSLRLRWNSDTNHAYSVERTTSLKPPLTFSLLRSNVPGLPGTTTFIDTTAPATGAGFYRIGTDSTNGAPPLWLHPPVFVPASVVVTWSSVTNRSYFLERATKLATPMGFTPLATNLTGQLGTTTYTDNNAVGPGPFFYRVGVQP